MKFVSIVALMLFSCALCASDALSAFSFHDGKERSMASFAGQTLIIVPLNGKC